MLSPQTWICNAQYIHQDHLSIQNIQGFSGHRNFHPPKIFYNPGHLTKLEAQGDKMSKEQVAFWVRIRPLFSDKPFYLVPLFHFQFKTSIWEAQYATFLLSCTPIVSQRLTTCILMTGP